MPPEETLKMDEVINVPCNKVDKAMARQIAQERGVPMAQIIREAIDTQHRMLFSNEPRCATGHRCLCASLHAVNQVNGPSGSERVLAVHHRQNPDEYMER